MDSKTLCLAVLARGPASGYEIEKTLEQPPHSLFQDTSFGSIYPALTRLAEEGAVTVTAFAQQKRPAKKVFALSEAGRARLVETLGQPPGPDRLRSDFLFTLLNGDLLPPALLLRTIDSRIAELEEKLRGMSDCGPTGSSPCGDFLHGLGMAYYGAVLAYLRENRPRLAEALERRPDGDAKPPPSPRD